MTTYSKCPRHIYHESHKWSNHKCHVTMSFMIVVVMNAIMETYPIAHNVTCGTKIRKSTFFYPIIWCHMAIKSESNKVKPFRLGCLTYETYLRMLRLNKQNFKPQARHLSSIYHTIDRTT